MTTVAIVLVSALVAFAGGILFNRHRSKAGTLPASASALAKEDAERIKADGKAEVARAERDAAESLEEATEAAEGRIANAGDLASRINRRNRGG